MGTSLSEREQCKVTHGWPSNGTLLAFWGFFGCARKVGISPHRAKCDGQWDCDGHIWYCKWAIKTGINVSSQKTFQKCTLQRARCLLRLWKAKMGRPLLGACVQRLALSAGMARAKGAAARAWCVLCTLGISLHVALKSRHALSLRTYAALQIGQ